MQNDFALLKKPLDTCLNLVFLIKNFLKLVLIFTHSNFIQLARIESGCTFYVR
mgnify:CR=1 FL=1